MVVNIKKLRELMNRYADGNYNEFARLTQINVSLLYRILNYNAGAGVKTINAIIDFCKNNNLDYKEYIFLD